MDFTSGIATEIDNGLIKTIQTKLDNLTKPVKNFLFFGHVSNESYHRFLLSEIGAEPILDLEMRLGEGSGAALAIQIIVQAMNSYHQMATFSSAGVANRDV